ncbi:hypothetical protein OsJ_08824 [Oryza sativa Japonica Group]|uniref:Uncharacterized protein n=1 Tax=Oryza sativa subsp. japonica TaxID=39947 RepID=Q6K5W6_ORYSJ|nr:hypothetical protein OsJ_08824 [Oryza sativa Japonica Group]BAD22032.1 hypothetical protein [Oryza sativa Japonica Group]
MSGLKAKRRWGEGFGSPAPAAVASEENRVVSVADGDKLELVVGYTVKLALRVAPDRLALAHRVTQAGSSRHEPSKRLALPSSPPPLESQTWGFP